LSPLTAGSRVQPREEIGTIERIRPSSDGSYEVAEVLWDTGARCPEPLSWLSSLEDREAERQAAKEEAKELRRLQREQERRERPAVECVGCERHFSPARKSQRFHSKSCVRGREVRARVLTASRLLSPG
jgi:hypothetical protein